jgi:hypothetical protein
MRMVAGSNRGFTLVDAMVACALFTGGLVVVAGALDTLSAAESATGARAHARELAVSVLAELKGLPMDAVFQYSHPAEDSGQVQVELVNSTGQVISLPARGLDVNAFPLHVEARVKAAFRDKRGHVIEAQSVGFLTGRGTP